MERRLAAVLAADVAGYSRLMGCDEEGTLARLKAVRKALVDRSIDACCDTSNYLLGELLHRLGSLALGRPTNCLSRSLSRRPPEQIVRYLRPTRCTAITGLL